MNSSNVRRSAITGCLMLLATLGLGGSAPQVPEVWNQPAFTASPQDLLKATASITAPAETDVVVLLEEHHYSLDEQGRAIETWRMIYRPLTPQGVEGWSVVMAEWEPWHQDKPELRARVITPKGVVHPLDAKTISDSPVGQNDPNVFTDRRSLRAPLPAMEAGSVVEEQVVTRDTAPLFDGGVVHRVYLTRPAPIQRRRLIVDAPATLPLRHAARLVPESAVRREEAGGRVKLTLELGPLEAMEDAAPYLPPEAPPAPLFTFATGKSWREIAARYNDVVEAQLRGADVSSLVSPSAATKDRVQLARELTARLHKEIRYTGIEFGEAGLVPRPPAETLQRKYGDCKDKAALLIAMLRAAGMPAHLALLSTGDETEPDLPGIGLFDHAIVYAPGSPDIWIDATAEFARAGELPLADQGRLALILRPDSETLLRTPEAPPDENRVLETREFFLAEFGKARVVETTDTWGPIEQTYRSSYGKPETKETREQLEDYFKQYYLAEALTRFEHGAEADYSKPFRITLEAAKAGRGNTGDTDAAVGIFLWQVANRLPAEFFDDADDADPGGKDGISPLTGKVGRARTADLVLPQHFVTEWRYRIVPPPGFRARKLPENGEKRMGPATVKSDYALQPDGVVTAAFRFSTGKRRMSSADAMALRAGIRELRKAPAVLIVFDQAGELLLAGGDTRGALAEFRKLVAMHPAEALHHSQIARGLLVAGLGEAARAQAREAVRVEPQSSQAHQSLGWILQHDLVGRRFKKGFDLEVALASYRKAKELDPKNYVARADLAILLEHNAKGVRYAGGARLDEAIAEYRALEKEWEDFNMRDNLAFALLWAKHFPELKTFLEKGTGSDTTRALNLAAIAASDGPAAAIAKAGEIGDSARRTALQNAGSYLLQIRHYPQAAEMFTASARGAADAASLLSRAEFFRTMKRHEEVPLSDTDPRQAVSKFFVTTFLSDSVAEVEKCLSRWALEEWKVPGNARRNAASLRSAKVPFQRTGLPMEVGVDLYLGVTQMGVEGDDATGYRVVMQSPFGPSGGTRIAMLAVREGGKVRILDTAETPTSAGLEVLDRVEKGDLAGARRLLDWIREDVKLGGGEDPLSGHVFARLWTRGNEGSREDIRVAAAGMIAGSELAERAIPILTEARERASTDAARENLDLALSVALAKKDRFAEMIPVAQRLLAAHPKSLTAFNHVTTALTGAKKWAECDAAAQDRMKLLPDDPDAIRALADNAAAQGKIAEALKVQQRLVELGKAGASDYNGMAWNALVMGTVNPEAFQSAQRATSMTNNSSFPSLHTLAALYAETGKPSEARAVLLQAMEVAAFDEPESESWYVFGRIAEHFGEKETALSAYRKVEKPEKTVHPLSTYLLAQRRITALGSK